MGLYFKRTVSLTDQAKLLYCKEKGVEQKVLNLVSAELIEVKKMGYVLRVHMPGKLHIFRLPTQEALSAWETQIKSTINRNAKH